MSSLKVLGIMLSFLLLAQSGEAFFAQEYTLTDLGAYIPVAIDKVTNEIIGDQTSFQPDGSFQGFVIYPTFQELGFLPTGKFTKPWSIKASRVVGDAEVGSNGIRHGFVYDGTLRQLQDFTNSHARCTNANKDVFGSVDRITNGVGYPSVWITETLLMELPTLDPRFGGQATTCNDTGDSAGISYDVGGSYFCTIWFVSGLMLSCDFFGANHSYPVDMLNTGFVIGNAGGNGRVFGYLWFSGAASEYLPLPGEQDTQVYGMNDSGDVVGLSCPRNYRVFNDCTAVGWENGKAFSLLSRTQNAEGWRFAKALGVSNDGRILIDAYHATLGERTVLLTPQVTVASAAAQPGERRRKHR